MEETQAVGFLDEVSGQGFENVTSKDVVTPLLLVAQQLSAVVASGTVKAGHFYNSVTGEDYGDELKLVICDYRRMWYVWKENQQGLAGIFEPGSIEVTGDPFTGMKDAQGQKVEEKMVFVVVLPEHKDAGYMVYGSTPGTIKYTKQWLTQAQNLRLPSGKIAPLFGSIWNVKLALNTSKANQKYYAPAVEGKSTFKFVSFIDEVLYHEAVEPTRKVAAQAALTADTHVGIEADEGVAEETKF